jgi:amicyanin
MVFDVRYTTILLALILVAGLASAYAMAATSTVDIRNNAFTPQDITIKAGDTVTWTNQDTVKHDVDFDSFKSPLLGQGETYSHTFDKPGTYSYDCDVHPFMKGRVTAQ